MLYRLINALSFLNIRWFSLLFFFLSPFFINQGDRVSISLVYGLGYLSAFPIIVLSISYIIGKISKPIRFHFETWVTIGIVIQTLISIGVNAPELLLDPLWYFIQFFKLSIPLFCFLILIKVLNSKDLSILYSFMFILGVASIFVLIVQLPYGLSMILQRASWRYSFIFDDANKNAEFCAGIIGLTMPLMVRKYSNGQSASFLLIVNIGLAAEIICTSSRSGMIALFFVFVVSIISMRNLRVLVISLIAISPLILIMLGAILLRYTSKSVEVSDMLHALTFKFAFEVVKDSPFFGVGLGNILEVYNQKLEGFYIGRLVVHNTLLGISADFGVPAALLWVAFMFVPAFRILKRIITYSRQFYPYVEIGAFNLLMTIVLSGLFLPHTLLDDFYWTWMAIPYIVYNSSNFDDHIQLNFRFSRTA